MTNATVKIETDVLIVGSGPAGSAAAALLSTYGVDNVLVTKYRWLANTPRAHITNQRTMEVLRDLGLEERACADAMPQELMGNNVFCTSLAGEELGRLHSWGTHPHRQADYDLASPTKICDLPQTMMEPLLFEAACARGTKARLSTEYVGLVQDGAGVTATVRDRLTGDEYGIRAKYLIGADGGRSLVAEQLGLATEGQMGVGGSMNIVFKGDLTPYVAHRPSVLYWVLQPGSNVGGIGMGLVRAIRPWDEWLIVWGYDINDGPPEVTNDFAKGVAHALIGDDAVPLDITQVSTWTVNNFYAKEVMKGRVFCLGDAIHRHPPSNGLGSNTSIQDAYNLAWKLKLVLKGAADPSLLQTYQDERAPIAEQIVTRANRSITEFGPIFATLGLLESDDPDAMKANMVERKEDNGQAREQRRALREAIAAKTYEFNCHGVEMNQRYASTAVVADGTPEPEWTRCRELYHQATTWPGARVPHAWVFKGKARLSTLDLAGGGRFALLTGIGGEGWIEAARVVAGRTGAEIEAYQIGPGCDYEDYFGDWARLSEVEDAGCVLLRPDAHVAFRAKDRVADATGTLGDAMARLLGRAKAMQQAAE